jgi:hypothetical protein
MKTKKQLLFLVILVALFQFVACGQFPSESVPTVSASTQTPYPTYTPFPTNTPYPTYTPFVQTASADISYPNSFISLTVYFPGNYALVKGDEENRRGSFSYYNFEPFGDFIPANDPYFSSQPPYFYEIQFFDEESIDNFLKNCATTDLGGMPCFEGDYPDLDRYHTQKEAFENMRSYDSYDLKRFGNRYYLTSTIGCGGGYCNIREYTTFIDKIKIDIWILLDPSDVESQTELSDKLFKSFYIETHQ